MAEPGVDLVHRFGETLLELLRLGAENGCNGCTSADQQTKKQRKNYGHSDRPRDASLLEPVRSLREREPEQHPEKKEKDHRVCDPEQPNSDVESEYQRKDANYVARWKSDRVAGIHYVEAKVTRVIASLVPLHAGRTARSGEL
jgi:hypothetical protein